MLIKGITIGNYKSIEKVSLPIEEIKGVRCFPYMGINEAGKTSILNGVSLLNKNSPVSINYKKDCFSGAKKKGEPIYITFEFELEPADLEQLFLDLKDSYNIKKSNIPKKISQTIKYDKTNTRSYSTEFSNAEEIHVKAILFRILDTEGKSVNEGLTFEQLDELTLTEGQTTERYTSDEVAITEEILESISKFVSMNQPRVVLWRSEAKYLITDQTDIASFIANPDEVSIPLKNCFMLMGISNIPEKISDIKDDSNERRDFAEEMSKTVTKHIKDVWKEHAVEVEFEITDTTITTSVRDKDADRKSNRIAPSQRSDGFKRMISFILNISAENMNGNLENTILLLDEPETQVHPTGQEFLRDELVKISKNNDNLVLYATHSPYMVNRDKISRVIHVQKNLEEDKNSKTEIEEIPGENITFAEINYKILNIPTTDYHNELYGYLHARYIDEAKSPEEQDERNKMTKFDNEVLIKYSPGKTVDWKRNTGNVDKVSKHTYIRNCIHHPEVATKTGAKFSAIELRNSIEALKQLKDKPPKEKTKIQSTDVPKAKAA